ncbi:uncharacterized protein B0T23DRAFT_163111 [Neurospora hispaniola]|uniref:Uncharacterized protein n=1 Tax=Neurospora hispaniola TaxID=588809 RepID=A0AAJ0I5H7_9PEZI|nr:hypothetical protein B0T23DRAFT_163111 [Neurospora hispaniola]
MGCAVDACYSTEPFSTTLVDIITTISGGKTITTTQISAVLTTPTPPPALTGIDDNSGAIPKFLPSSVPKASAIPKDTKDSDGSGGLKGAQLGGIIGGAIALLIIVIIAAFLIIRRLKRVESAMESRKGSTSGYHSKASYTKTSKTGASQAQMEQSNRFLHVRAPSDTDNASADPLMFMSETNTPGDHTTNAGSLAGTPQPGAHGVVGDGGIGRHGRSGSDTTYMASPHGAGNNNGSELASPDPNSGYFDGASHLPSSHTTSTTYAGGHNGNGNGMRQSVDSQSTGLGYHYSSTRNQNQHHWRNQSNASELSADGSEITHGVASPLVGSSHARGASGGSHSYTHSHSHTGLGDVPELDSSGIFVELPATTTTTATTSLPPRNSFGLSSASRRRRTGGSNPNTSTPQSPNTDSSQQQQQNNLVDVRSEPETAEFITRPHQQQKQQQQQQQQQQQHTSLDGYYGPAKRQVGQTAASGLGFVPERWDGSSPGAYPMGFPMISVPGYGLGVSGGGGGGGGPAEEGHDEEEGEGDIDDDDDDDDDDDNEKVNEERMKGRKQHGNGNENGNGQQ